MGRLIYACKFDVADPSAFEDSIAPSYARWIGERYERAFDKQIEIQFPEAKILGDLPYDHTLLIRHHGLSGEVIEIDWQFPGERGLIWRNHALLANTAGLSIVQHTVELSSSEYLIAPASFKFGAPGVIKEICAGTGISVGQMQLRPVAYPLSADAIDQFVGLLHASERRLPIVLLTPFANGDRCLIDAQSLADRLAGVAIIAEADSPETTRLLSDAIGTLGCYDGGIRIYWPQFALSDDLRRHPLLFSSHIASIGRNRTQQRIERTIFSIAAFRFVPDDRIANIVKASEAAERAARADEARHEGGAGWEKYAIEIAGQLDDALAELAALRSENANLKSNQSVLFSFSSGEAEENDDEETATPIRHPVSVLEAVEHAAEDFVRLDFLSSSFAAAEDSPFVRPKEIYDDLSKMNQVADVWARNQGGGDLRQMLKDAGLGRRVSSFISKTAKGKWGSEYTFEYDGSSRLFEWHVTLGAGAGDTCASIHFLPDSVRGKLVIAHVGRHLTNTRA